MEPSGIESTKKADVHVESFSMGMHPGDVAHVLIMHSYIMPSSFVQGARGGPDSPE